MCFNSFNQCGSSSDWSVPSMASIDEWAAFLSGDYQGRIRLPAGPWEDLIGSVKLVLAPAGEGCLNVTITVLEFGTWVGCLRLQDMVMKGPTGQGDTYFECTFQERGQTEEIQGCFVGEIFEPPAEPLFELHLASEWRKRRPALRNKLRLPILLLLLCGGGRMAFPGCAHGAAATANCPVGAGVPPQVAPSKEVGKMSTNADLDVGNKQVLADTLRNLVRYALLKTRRDVVKLGVTPSSFSVAAMDGSLAASANVGIFGKQSAPSLTTLLTKARESSLTFLFYWKASNAREPLEAAFALSYEPDGDLKVRLLWLGLPERVPISPRVGVIDGRQPLEEAVMERLRVLKGGRLAPYPPPA